MEISAITLFTSDMSRAVQFWKILRLEITYGGPNDPFTSLVFGSNFVNLQLMNDPARQDQPRGWGRVVFHVESPDDLWERFVAAGHLPLTEPADAPWGERFFHIVDPDGHELSFACAIADLSQA